MTATGRHSDSTLRTERVARSQRWCDDSVCREPIAAGERYTRMSLPPRTDVNTSDRWWTLHVHSSHVAVTGDLARDLAATASERAGGAS